MVFNYKYTDSKKQIFQHHNQLLKDLNVPIELVLFGDSITEGFDINRYGLTNKTYINAGIGGDRLPYMYERLERDVITHQPKEVIFMGGVNDLRAWYFDDNNQLNDIQSIIDHTMKYIDLIVTKLTENEITTKLCTITCNYEQEFNFEYMTQIINLVNEQIVNYAETNSIELIDYNQVLRTEYGYMDLNLSNDGLHPNEYGYIKMCELIKDHLIK